jgi:hypothetical protein
MEESISPILSPLLSPSAITRLLSGAAVGANASDRGEGAEVGAEMMLPRVFGLLGALPPPDLAALDAAFQQFLDRLDQLGGDLASQLNGSGLFPWIVAGGMAVAACEIGRRQFQRKAQPNGLTTEFPREHLLPE